MPDCYSNYFLLLVLEEVMFLAKSTPIKVSNRLELLPLCPLEIELV